MQFGDDDRAQAVQIGAVLLLGIVVVAMSIYQIQVVPQQNAEVEFQHNQEVQEDMVETRGALVSAAKTGQDQAVAVRLGTTYPARTLAINPPAPSGTFRTTEPRAITVEDADGNDVSAAVCPASTAPETRFVEYDADYNEYQPTPTLRYENSVLYKDFADDEVVMTSQQLVSENYVNLLPVTGEYSQSGSGTISVEAIAGDIQTTTVTDPEVTVPTELSQATWEDLLRGQVSPADVTVSGGELALDLSGSYTVVCAPTGVDSVPPSGRRAGGGFGDGAGTGDGETGNINPGDDASVVLQQATTNAGDNLVTVTFDSSTAKEIDRVRYQFFLVGAKQPDRDQPQSVTIAGGDPIPIRETFANGDLTPNAEIDGVTDLEFRFYRNTNGNQPVTVRGGDFFVVTFEFEDGTVSTYFISPSE